MMKKLNLSLYKESVKKLSNDVPILMIGIVVLIFYIAVYVIFGVDCRSLLIFSFISILMGCYIIVLMKLRDRKDKREATSAE